MKTLWRDPVGAGFMLNLALLAIYTVLVAAQWVWAAF